MAKVMPGRTQGGQERNKSKPKDFLLNALLESVERLRTKKDTPASKSKLFAQAMSPKPKPKPALQLSAKGKRTI